MSITIAPTDFSQDIVDTISPFLGAFGLLDANGNLDIDDWSMEKALGVFSTFERTELILNTIAGFVASPNYVLREKSTGLIVESGELPPAETREEEWFPVYQGDGWSVNLTVVHEELTTLSISPHGTPHSIELGLGIHFDKELDLPNTKLNLSGRLGIPIVRVKNTGAIIDGIPEVDFDRLIWCTPTTFTTGAITVQNDSGNPFELWRIALSAKIRPPNNERFNSSAPSAAAIALRAAFGQQSTVQDPLTPQIPPGDDGLVAHLSLLDFIARENNSPSTLDIDLVNLVSGGLSGVLDSIIPALVELLPEGAERFADNLLPMLGLLDTDWSSYPEFTDGDSYEIGDVVQFGGNYYEVVNNQATAAESGSGPSHTSGTQTVWAVDLEYVSITLPSWPRLDLIALVGDLDDLDAAWTRIRTWLLELTAPEVATQWLTHLYTLIFDGTPPSGTIDGACTIDDPVSLKIIDIAGVSVQLLVALWTDTDGTTMLDVGLRVSAEREIGTSEVEVEGGMTVWLASVPLTGGRSITFIPELLADFLIGKTTGDLLSLSVSQNTFTPPSPLANLSIDIEKARLGISFPRGGDVEPIVELLDVTFGTNPEQEYPVVDLTSGSSIMDALGGALDVILDTISDALAENDVLQWLGSLVGLVAPRGYPFRLVDTELVDGRDYVEGELFFHEISATPHVYKVLNPGPNPTTAVDDGTPVLTTAAGPQIVWSLSVECVGPNTAIWETGDSGVDLRLDILRMIQDPLDELTDYYARLLETQIDPYGQGPVTAWVYVQEALVLLINTALSVPLKIDKPSMPTSQITVIGDGTSLSPWRTMIGGEGDIPGINLFTYVEDTDQTGVNRLTFGLGCLVSLLQLRTHLHLETNLDIGLLSLNLAEVATPDVPAEAKLLPKIDLTMKLHDAIVYAGDDLGGTAWQIPILSMPGLNFTVDAFSLGLNWINGDGFGLKATVHSPRIGSIAPDFPHLAAQLPDIRSLGQFHWGGGRLHGPHGSTRPNMDSFVTDGSDDFDDPLPDAIQYEDEAGNTVNLTVQWDFHGLGCLEVGFDTRSGMFGLIDRTGTTNALLDLGPNGKVIENEGIQMIVGQILALKGGSIGFMFATLFRINPHLIHLDLGRHIRRQGLQFELGDWIISRHPDWSSYYPNIERTGLGPFSLPYDWPQLDWAAFITQPLVELNRFIVDVLHNVSDSGEPFVFPFLRWMTGLVRGSIPNLEKPGLGWPMTFVDDEPVVVIPDIPVEVTGQGTYDFPYSVCISSSDSANIEFLIWVGPDGPLSTGQVDNVLSTRDAISFDLLQEANLDIVEINYELDQDWPRQVADSLVRLSHFSERVKTALGDRSLSYIENALKQYDHLLKVSDGVSSLSSQQSGSTSTNIRQNLAKAYHHSALYSDEIVSEISHFTSSSMGENWVPSTGELSGQHLVLVLLSTNDVSNWDECVQGVASQYLDSQDNPATFPNIWSIEYPSSDSTDSSSPFTPQTNTASSSQESGIVKVQLSKQFTHPSQNNLLGLKNQILDALTFVQSAGNDQLLLVAHSVCGKALLDLVDDALVSDNIVQGILTVNSPNSGTILDGATPELKFAIQLLYTLSSGASESTLLPSGSNTEDYLLTASSLEATLSTLLEVSDNV